jgi:hypothetical protein
VQVETLLQRSQALFARVMQGTDRSRRIHAVIGCAPHSAPVASIPAREENEGAIVRASRVHTMNASGTRRSQVVAFEPGVCVVLRSEAGRTAGCA